MTGAARVLVDSGASAPVLAAGPFGLPVPGEFCELEGAFVPGAPASGGGAARHAAVRPGPQERSSAPAAAAPSAAARNVTVRPGRLPPRLFSASGCSLLPPRDPGGYAAFLSSGLIGGLDRAAAQELVKAFGEDVLRALAEAPHDLAGVRGLKAASRERAVAGVRAFLGLKRLAALLAPRGLGPLPAAALLRALGPGAPETTERDPGHAARALAAHPDAANPGAFRRAAARLLATADPPLGTQALAEGEILVALGAMRAAGEYSAPESRLWRAARASMPGTGEGGTRAAFREGLEGLVRKGGVRFRPAPAPFDPDGRRIFLPESLRETQAAEGGLAALISAAPPAAYPEPREALARAEALCGFPLDAGQRAALAAVLERKAALVTGPRGSGKRLLASAMGAVFRERGLPALFASATRRGAGELSRAAGAPAHVLADILAVLPEREGPGGPGGPGGMRNAGGSGLGAAQLSIAGRAALAKALERPPGSVPIGQSGSVPIGPSGSVSAGQGASVPGGPPGTLPVGHPGSAAAGAGGGGPHPLTASAVQAGLLAVTEAELTSPGDLARLLLAVAPGTALALFADPWRVAPPGPPPPRPGDREGPGGTETPEAGGCGADGVLPGWLAALAEGRREQPRGDPRSAAPRPGPRERLLRPARLSGTYSRPGARIPAALAALREGVAPPGSESPDGDFFWIPGDDESELARKAVRLIAERIPKKLGLPPREAALALCGGAEGPLGAPALAEAIHAALCGSPPQADAGGRLRPGARVLQAADDPAKGLARGDCGTVVSAAPGSLAAAVRFGDREIACGPDALGALVPAWALPISFAPPWASFPAAVVALGKGSDGRLDRYGLARAASLAERLLIVIGRPETYARILASRNP
jgi:hypothetical protein